MEPKTSTRLRILRRNTYPPNLDHPTEDTGIGPISGPTLLLVAYRCLWLISAHCCLLNPAFPYQFDGNLTAKPNFAAQ